jgi:preprotein translocase subunit SecG
MWLKLLIGFLLVIHFLVGVFLIILVLMQRTKEGGIGAAFGAGMTESLFGASTGNVLSKITVWSAGIFFATSLTMAVVFSHMPRKQTEFERVHQKTPITNTGTQGALPPKPVGTETPSAPASGTDVGTATAPAQTPSGTVTPETLQSPAAAPQTAPSSPETPSAPAPAPTP